jgi:hypothetical protein
LKILHLGLQCTQLCLRGILFSTQRTDRLLLLRLPVGDLALLRPRDIKIRLQTIRTPLLDRDQPVSKVLLGFELGPADLGIGECRAVLGKVAYIVSAREST